jgi:hypothetical protein
MKDVRLGKIEGAQSHASDPCSVPSAGDVPAPTEVTASPAPLVSCDLVSLRGDRKSRVKCAQMLVRPLPAPLAQRRRGAGHITFGCERA